MRSTANSTNTITEKYTAVTAHGTRGSCLAFLYHTLRPPASVNAFMGSSSSSCAPYLERQWAREMGEKQREQRRPRAPRTASTRGTALSRPRRQPKCHPAPESACPWLGRETAAASTPGQSTTSCWRCSTVPPPTTTTGSSLRTSHGWHQPGPSSRRGGTRARSSRTPPGRRCSWRGGGAQQRQMQPCVSKRHKQTRRKRNDGSQRDDLFALGRRSGDNVFTCLVHVHVTKVVNTDATKHGVTFIGRAEPTTGPLGGYAAL